jgi:hypothetical protein
MLDGMVSRSREVPKQAGQKRGGGERKGAVRGRQIFPLGGPFVGNTAITVSAAIINPGSFVLQASRTKRQREFCFASE